MPLSFREISEVDSSALLHKVIWRDGDGEVIIADEPALNSIRDLLAESVYTPIRNTKKRLTVGELCADYASGVFSFSVYTGDVIGIKNKVYHIAGGITDPLVDLVEEARKKR